MSDLAAAPAIHRHRTAMVRHDLSQPMALMVRFGLVKPGVRVFDYGCGQGDDLRILEAAGVGASGWDPYFRPDAPRQPAPAVNLGFVLNVIEDPHERRDALKGAWSLTERVLAVATMIVGQVPVSGLRPHGDGYLTSRGTFQKYFQHAELRALIAQTLQANPVAIAPGIFFVFREPEEEQEFLLNRRAGRRSSTAAYRVARPARPRTPSRPALPERIPQAIDEVAAFIRQRGRTPQADELTSAANDELSAQKVSLARAIETALETALSADELAAAAAGRREDLLVHHALDRLNRSASAARPSAAMVRDIRTHFGSQKELSLQALEYLHGLADEARVRAAMDQAVAEGLGLLDHRQRLIVDGERAETLPGLLRCYFGCATFLAGEPEGPFVLRVDPSRKRLTMWPLVNPQEVLPQTELSIRIDLRRQDVSVRPDARRLLRKGELQGLRPRSKQRQAEAEYRLAKRMPDDAVFERLELRPRSDAEA